MKDDSDEFDALLASEGLDQAVLDLEEDSLDVQRPSKHKVQAQTTAASSSSHSTLGKRSLKPDDDKKDDKKDSKDVDSDEEYYRNEDGAFDVTGFGEGGKSLSVVTLVTAIYRH